MISHFKEWNSKAISERKDGIATLRLQMSLLVKIKNELLPCGRVLGCARAINALRKYTSQFCNPRSLAAEYNMDAKHAKSLVVHLEQIFRASTIYTSTVGAAVGAYEHPHAMDSAILEE